MKAALAGIGCLLFGAPALTGCMGYSHGLGVAPDDARGMTQADSACDFGRSREDMGSLCYVSRRPYDYTPGDR
jgi:hypothetical protein